MFSVIKTRKIWFTISGILIATSLAVLAIWGLDLGIDFTGGGLMEIEFNTQRPPVTEVITILQPLNIGSLTVQNSGEAGMILRFASVDEATHQQILTSLDEGLRQSLVIPEEASEESIKLFEEKRFTSIGPTVGAELKRKTFWAISIALVAIILYVAWAFRKVSHPVASWKYGVIAVIALLHDVILTVGVFAVLGKFYGLEVNAPFIAAILTVLGYSVNDTIVVFDRTRENIMRHIGKDFGEVIDLSLNQVITRSINTSFTTLLVLFAVFLFGGPTIRDFILALIIGISVGTYSSIFLASPLLVVWQKYSHKS